MMMMKMRMMMMNSIGAKRALECWFLCTGGVRVGGLFSDEKARERMRSSSRLGARV